MTKTQAITALIAAVLIIGGIYITNTGWRPDFKGEPKQPPLERQIAYPENFPQEARAPYEQNLATTKENINKNPNNIAAWLDLAIYYRMVGDYKGAVEVWEYLVAKNPNDAISLHNIAENYFHQEKDYPKAEEYYRRAIAANPALALNYSDLHEMYRYVYRQDTQAAVEIIQEALAKVDVRSAINLSVTLGRYYEEKGDMPNARTHYTQARDAAKSVGEVRLAQQIDEDIARVSQ